jgi:group I intron endonuclease
MKSGIYKISFCCNKYFYIGSSANLKKRSQEHISDLNRNAHCNKKMQHIFNKHKDFNFETIELVAIEKLAEREQFYIDTLSPNVNILKIAYSSFGFKHYPKTIEKLIGIANERKLSKKWIEAVSKGWFKKGQKQTMPKESIKKRAESYMGYKHRDDSKVKMSIAAKARDNSKRDFSLFNKVGVEATKKPVVQICSLTQNKITFESITSAIKQYNTNQTRHLVNAIKTGKKYKKCYWQFADKNLVNTSL